MTLAFASTNERRRGYKAGTVITPTVPAIPSTPVLGVLSSQSGTIKRVTIISFDVTANGMTVDVSLNGLAYQSTGLTVPPGSTYFDYDVGSASTFAFRARAYNDSGPSSSYSNIVSGSIGSNVFPFPSANRSAAVAPAMLVYPRQDSETPSWARHKKAYFDGVNQVRYEIVPVIAFGSPPFKFSMITGPVGMTIGQLPGDVNYGVLTWNPTQAYTNEPVDILVENQDSSTPVHIQYSISTSQSLADFCFADSGTAGNDTTGTGTFLAPFKTLAKVWGTALGNGAATANTRLYLRSGTYANTGWGGSYGIGMLKNNTPMSLIGFPDETIQLNLTAAGNDAAWSSNGSNTGDDWFCQNITLLPGSSTTNLRTFFFNAITNRVTFDKLTVPNPANGALNNDNNTTIMFASPGTGTYHQYYALTRCVETGRTGGNASALTTMFCNKYFVLENNRTVTTGNAIGMYVKASCSTGTIRYCDCTGPSNKSATSTGCQIDASLDANNIEYCYNVLSNGGSSIQDEGCLTLNFQFSSTHVGTHWVWRNTIIGGVQIRNAISGVGPFFLDKNVIVVASGQPVYGFFSAVGVNVTQTNTQLHGLVSNGYVDMSTKKLTGVSRTNYLGKLGAEISAA